MDSMSHPRCTVGTMNEQMRLIELLDSSLEEPGADGKPRARSTRRNRARQTDINRWGVAVAQSTLRAASARAAARDIARRDARNTALLSRLEELRLAERPPRSPAA